MFKFTDYDTEIYKYVGDYIGDYAPVCIKNLIRGHLWGFVDKKGNLVVPCQFMDVCVYKDGFVVLDNISWTVWHPISIDQNGYTVSELRLQSWQVGEDESYQNKTRTYKIHAGMEDFVKRNPDVEFEDLLYHSSIDLGEEVVVITAKSRSELLEKKIALLKDVSRHLASLQSEVEESIYDEKHI